MGVHAERDSSVIWRKSRRSSNSGNCVEIASSGVSVLVRDSHDRSRAVLVVTAADWRRLVRAIRNSD